MLCVDEKTQIQALDRMAPILPMMPGVPQRASHDYKRSGTSSLYAALDITTGKVIGQLHSRHRAIEFKKFLTTLDKEVPADLDVHLVLDNSSTHKTPAIQRWLVAHPTDTWLRMCETCIPRMLLLSGLKVTVASHILLTQQGIRGL